VLLVVRLPAPIDVGLGPCSCSGLPSTRGEHEAGRLVVDAAQVATPEKRQEEHSEYKTISTKEEGCPGWLTPAGRACKRLLKHAKF
jgi:hypothetical protein